MTFDSEVKFWRSHARVCEAVGFHAQARAARKLAEEFERIGGQAKRARQMALEFMENNGGQKCSVHTSGDFRGGAGKRTCRRARSAAKSGTAA